MVELNIFDFDQDKMIYSFLLINVGRFQIAGGQWNAIFQLSSLTQEL